MKETINQISFKPCSSIVLAFCVINSSLIMTSEKNSTQNQAHEVKGPETNFKNVSEYEDISSRGSYAYVFK